MLILKILENDLHRSKNALATPLIVEIPAFPEFLPSLVSNSRGKFLVSEKLTRDNRIKVGVFRHDSEKMDEIIPTMLSSALELSRAESWKNVFGLDGVKNAFEYIKKESNLPAQPHVCLVPSSWERDRLSKIFGVKAVGLMKYRRFCRIIQIDIPFIVFLSKPDMVGMYTHFLGGPSAILLHNIRRGISFCA